MPGFDTGEELLVPGIGDFPGGSAFVVASADRSANSRMIGGTGILRSYVEAIMRPRTEPRRPRR